MVLKTEHRMEADVRLVNILNVFHMIERSKMNEMYVYTPWHVARF